MKLVPQMDGYARKYPLDPEAEYASRELARNSFLDFVTYTYSEYYPEPFHIQLAGIMEQVITGDIKRLMVFAPPQHGKSELISVRFPAYWISKKHRMPTILCSYGATLAWEKVASMQNTVYSQEYYNLFPDMFKEPPHRWKKRGNKMAQTIGGTKIYAAGVRGAITGRGAGLGIIDDPVKDWRDAYSPNIREATWQWWRGTFRPRIWANGRIIIIMTRWHEDDLAGRILNTTGENWTVVRYPAIAENDVERKLNNEKYLKQAVQLYSGDPLDRDEGEALCPHRYSLQSLLDIKVDVGPRAWSAEYQGTPKPVEGNMIKLEWMHYVDEWPHEDVVKFVRYWDKAGTQGSGARTAGVLLAFTKRKTYYLLDCVTGQWSAYQREEVIKNTAIQDEQTYGKVETWIEREPGSGGKESAENTIRNLAGFDIHAESPRDSKEVRMEPLSSQMEAGNVFILQRKWTWEVTDELLMWPFGPFKDIGDAFSGAFRKCLLTGWSRSGG